MKTIRLAASTILFGGLSAAHAGQVLLSDNFTGSTLNPANWQANTPVPGASVAVDNGLILSDGGDVLSQTAFPDSIEIDMAFEFTGTEYDSFHFVTRSDGTLDPGSVQFADGIDVSFRMMSDTGETADNISLFDQAGSTGTELGFATYAIVPDEIYDVRLLETPTGVSLFVGDLSTPILTADMTDSYGGLIGLNDREGAAAGSSISAGSQVTINSFDVTSVSDAPSSMLLLTPVVLGLFGFNRQSRRKI